MPASRYHTRFAALQGQGKAGFIPFTMLGWPDLDTSRRILYAMTGAGVTALELGVAFSDPIADGPVIQSAAHEAIAAGVTLNDGLNLVREVRANDAEIPIGLLVYYNGVLSRGIDQFYRDVAEAGVDGVLIADLPSESAEKVVAAAKKHDVAPIFIVSPLTHSERINIILKQADGFIYVVSRLGITGTHENYDVSLAELISRLHKHTELPLCVGFGISKPEHARHMLELGADGVVVGSRVLELVRQTPPEQLETVLAEYFASFVTLPCRASHD